jgi:hypothetical protein
MPNAEHSAGDPAPVTGVYRLLNVLGGATHVSSHVVRGDPLPGAPIGHVWRLEQARGEPET